MASRLPWVREALSSFAAHGLPDTGASRAKDRSGTRISRTAQEPRIAQPCQSLPAAARQCASSRLVIRMHCSSEVRPRGADDDENLANLEARREVESEVNLRTAPGSAGTKVYPSRAGARTDIPPTMVLKADEGRGRASPTATLPWDAPGCTAEALRRHVRETMLRGESPVLSVTRGH
ncbi:hypothetical protein L227DRAFT_348904 [Lentinus tigrinus ALCF2SS1-6]|uniref:Uncharacterized protein n=1 Tax=Lentinus tigrinus ALCF2SS1-6 TaxID=1328759 RepID=A0A5C2RVL5_9APHY|nr:hypothetical protein L227DRAFT_348904 [Lentinus tigrinus ALCF2SS1-6]